MKTPLVRYTACWLVLAAVGLLLSACQTSDPPVAHAAVPDAAQVQPSTPTSAERGQELYRKNCAFCHGGNGERGAKPLMDTVGQLDDATLAEIILVGVPEKGMPVSKKLTNEQIADLVAFIRSWNSQ